METLPAELRIAIAASSALDIVDVRRLARVNSAWRSALLPYGQLWGRITKVIQVDSIVLTALLARSKQSLLEWDVQLVRQGRVRHAKPGPIHNSCKPLLTANFSRTRSLTLRPDGLKLSTGELNALFTTPAVHLEALHIFTPHLKGLPHLNFQTVAPNLRHVTIQLSQLQYVPDRALQHVTDVRVVAPPKFDVVAEQHHRLVYLERVAPSILSLWLDYPPLDSVVPDFTALRQLTVDARRADSGLFPVGNLEAFHFTALKLFALNLFTLVAPPVDFSLPFPSGVEELSVLRRGESVDIELRTLASPTREVHRYIHIHMDALRGLARTVGHLEHLELDLWVCPAVCNFVHRLSFSQLRRLSLVMLPDDVLDAGVDGINLLQDEKLNKALDFPALRQLTLTTAPVGPRPRPQLPPSSRYSIEAGDILDWITSRELELNQKFELGIDWRIHVGGKSKINTLRGLTTFIESIPFFED